MPKIVVSREGQVLMEWPLETKAAIIGRGTDCEIHLQDPSVSRHHAKVARIYNGYFIEDMHSTNGVLVNGLRVRKHMLRNGDRVQLGTHELDFIMEDAPEDDVFEADQTMVLKTAPVTKKRERIAAPPPSAQAGRAFVRFLSGPEQGDSRLVDRSLYTIGKPGGNLAVISRRAQGHFLLHLGGNPVTTLNGSEVHGAGVKLNSGDVIQVGDARLEFYSEP